jgi:hypothetical protein
MSGKPRLMWHADKEGRCHVDCEAFSRPGDSCRTNRSGCDVVDRLPWVPVSSIAVVVGAPCPFATLADVLCDAKPHEDTEKTFTADELGDFLRGYERAGATTVEERRLIRGLRVWIGIHDENSPKPEDEEHRCVTCQYLKTILPMTCKVTGKTDGIEPDGPGFDCPIWRK